ncbi:MAG: formate dehydrogenase subunit gamma [Gammaproteobacteria bacterium]|nr:formate dehydrogenase subunit gamma [Gammaproteobacteria bacterium]MBL6998272.1 formate dehydrogenase subunit gamma [Gammaproteobacteria bacterium]
MIKFVVSRQLRLLPGLLSVFLVLLFISLPQPGIADEHQKVEGISNKNPGADLWRNVRQRDQELLGSLKSNSQGSSQVKSVDSKMLINQQGDLWARFRMEQLIKYGMMSLGGILILILVFYLLRGRVNIDGGLSGNMVHRFNSYERVLHWVLALVFLFLAITGLTLLFGRTLLIPVMGHELFSVIASSSKEGHNLFGPIFLVSVVLMLIRFVKKNIYAKGDLTWLLKGGGMIGKSHVTGGFFNMGEKSWYWLVILIGLLISISGLILVSPNFGQGRVIMELSHVVHAAGALILIAVSFGHMYLGTVGTEGTNESMRTGYVDISWAEAHHDRWAKECHEKQLIVSAEQYAKLQGRNPINSEDSLSLEKNQ